MRNGPAVFSSIGRKCRGKRLPCEFGAKDWRRKGNCNPRDCRNSRNGDIFLTPDFARGTSRRKTCFLQLLTMGSPTCGLAGRDADIEERTILHAAALLQEVGHFKKDRAHHKESYRMIRGVPPPPGWTKRDLQLVALVARFHRRALPRPDHKILRAYEFPLRQSVILLAAILRFANAYHAKHDRAMRRLDVEDVSGVITVVRAEGISDREPLGAKLSTAKRLLEFACQRSVHILAPGTRMMSPRILRPATRIDAA